MTTDADLRSIVMDCDDRCRGPDMHDFYTGPRAFAWMRPRLDVGMLAAHKATRVALNRYPHHVIGAAVYVRGWGVGLRWKCSPSQRSRQRGYRRWKDPAVLALRERRAALNPKENPHARQ